MNSDTRQHPAFKRKAMTLAVLAGFGAACAAALPLAAQAVELEYRLKGTFAGVADGGRDLGLLDADDTGEGFVDFTPWVHLQFNPDWAAFVRVRGYASTGELLQPGSDDNNATVSDEDGFVALREAWLEYGGLSSYPGEVLRLGRQRIRGDDAQFFDQDMDALRWIFNTTLLDAELGVAHQFDSYRTDNVDIALTQKDRSYAFGNVAWDWSPMQRVGLRAVYAHDDNDLPDDGEAFDPRQRPWRSKQVWAGVFADNHVYDWKLDQPLSYWASATYLGGTREVALQDTGGLFPSPDGTPVSAGRVKEDVSAWAAEAGLRARVAGPLRAGAAYMHSSGGPASDPGSQYEQTGAQSNYSRFTGTRSQIYRYNEAFRPEQGNLQAATLFLSTSVGAYDASLVYNNFRRPRSWGPVISNGLVVTPATQSHDLGEGVDLVLTRYFSLGVPADAPRYTPQEIGDSSLRLRGSWFKPGDAYNATTPEARDAKDDYRVTLELTLWY